MSWVVLALALGFWLLACVKLAAATKIRTDAHDALERLDRAVKRAEQLHAMDKSVKRTRLVVLPAPFPLAALASTDCQGACALYSWVAIRGEGKA